MKLRLDPGGLPASANTRGGTLFLGVDGDGDVFGTRRY
jgi:predicted HTH transcriptional regulator